MKKRLVNQKQLSQILDISPQAVGKLVARGSIIRDSVGLIDLDHPENAAYLRDKGINPRKIKISASPATLKAPASTRSGNERTISELQKIKLEKQTAKLEIEIDRLNKKLLPIEFVDGVYILHVEGLHSLLERFAATYIRDVGKKILEAGEILPAHIEEFTGFILTAMHDNKMSVMKKLEAYDPKNSPGRF
ncbi:MAG: hypothetical protein JXA20_05505 [Spirochaetes bacterium]|nr:hypothetical protein [Spirochaetota bacterium]